MGTESRQNFSYWTIFSKRLKALLSEREIRQNALAEMLGIDPTSVNSWIQERKTPSAAHILEIADILDVSLDDLFGRTPPRKRKTKSGRRAGSAQTNANTRVEKRRKR